MITVKRHYKNNKVLWDKFVKSANNGTIFHLRRFLSYHPEGRFVDHSIEFYKKNTLFYVKLQESKYSKLKIEKIQFFEAIHK